MGVLRRGLLLHPAIAADRRINETSTNGSKDQTEYDCGNCAGGGEIFAADQLRVNKGQTSSKKGESKEGQKNGSAFGRLGHSLILGGFEGTKAERRSGIAFAVTAEPRDRHGYRARRWHEG